MKIEKIDVGMMDSGVIGEIIHNTLIKHGLEVLATSNSPHEVIKTSLLCAYYIQGLIELHKVYFPDIDVEQVISERDIQMFNKIQEFLLESRKDF